MDPASFSPLAVRIGSGVRFIYIKRQSGEGLQNRRTALIVGLPLALASSERLNSTLSSAGEVEKSAVHPSKVTLMLLIKPSCCGWECGIWRRRFEALRGNLERAHRVSCGDMGYSSSMKKFLGDVVRCMWERVVCVKSN